MLKNQKNKKKKGFTLVELIAVIAIIGILAAILVPTISGFITKSKKTKVVEQARQFSMAVESVAAEGKLETLTKNTLKLSDISTNPAFTEIIGMDEDESLTVEKVFNKLPTTITYLNAVEIAGGADFTVDDNGVFTGMKTAE